VNTSETENGTGAGAPPPSSDPFARLRRNTPQQARSRATLTRLLDAAEKLLDEGGLDAATVPAIAKRAGVSVGVVYRRFPDKDALLRAVFERFFARAREHNLAALQTIGRIQLPLPVLMRKLIHGTIEGQRRFRHILRALTHFYRTHRDPTFRDAAMEMNREAMRAISVVLLSHPERISHPNPEQAVEFAMLSLGAILHATVIEEEPLYTLEHTDGLEEELTRMLFAYLGLAVYPEQREGSEEHPPRSRR
jgi:AcrR family transcriptional regulator